MMLRNRKGFTIADIVLILIVIAIMAAAGSSFYIALFQQHRIVTQQMMGINLATAQVEDLMAIEDYNAAELSSGVTKPATVAIPAGYTLTYSIQDQILDGMLYKQIVATVTTPAPVRTVTLTGFKAKP